MSKTIAVGIGSRANYSSIKSFCLAIQSDKSFDLRVFVYSSAASKHYGDLEKEIRQDGLVIDISMDNLINGDTGTAMAKSTGLALLDLSNYFDHLRPDYVLTVGDRFETMAVAIAASYMQIPLIHTMGGEITGTLDEAVRHSITKLANIHFVSNVSAAEIVKKLGEPKNLIFNVGCPRLDNIKTVLSDSALSFELSEYGEGENINLKNETFIMISQHAVTTEYDTLRDDYLCTLEAVNNLGMKAIFFWPNADAGHDTIAKVTRNFREEYNPPWRFVRNIPNEFYAYLLSKTKVLIGNSSSGIRDANFVGTPVVNIGTRQNKRDFGSNVLHAKYDSSDILDKIQKQIANGHYGSGNLYGNGYAGVKMLKILKDLDVPSTQKLITFE